MAKIDHFSFILREYLYDIEKKDIKNKMEMLNVSLISFLTFCPKRAKTFAHNSTYITKKKRATC